MVDRSITVSDYMSHKVLSFKLTDNVGDIVSMLLEHKSGGGPVLDANKQVIGFISEQDCIKEMLNTAFYRALTANAGDIMKSPVASVSPDMPIMELAQQFDTAKPRMYPVIDQGKLVGAIGRTQVLQALHDISARDSKTNQKASAL